MAVSDGSTLIVVKDMGLVTHVFNDYRIAGLPGHLAIGHTRYSTTGSSSWHNAQPMYRQAGGTEFAVGHNGNLTNTEELAASIGMLPGMATSDSDLVAELVARELDHAAGARPAAAPSLVDALMGVLPRLEGAFSLVMADRSQIVGARDPNGFRPLCLGRLDDGWVLASETPALDITGAHFVREVEPGEVLAIDADGCRSLHPWPPERIEPRLCLFEFVYLARPDSRLYGKELHAARVRMGELLAEQAPVAVDMVVGVPDSGIPAAEGYSRRSGIPFGHALVKNRYIGRTFINPDPGQRAMGVRRMLVYWLDYVLRIRGITKRPTQLFRISLLLLGSALVYLTYTTKVDDQGQILLGLLVIILGFVPGLIWVRHAQFELPAFETFMVTTVPAYGIPLVSGHDQLQTYEQDTITKTAIAVVLFQAVALSNTWPCSVGAGTVTYCSRSRCEFPQ